jgi:predicted RNA-binding Zn ribbon-like protein
VSQAQHDTQAFTPRQDQAVKFEFVAGNLALDFANSVHDHGASDPNDDFNAYSDLADWSRQAGLLSQGQVRELKNRRPAQARLEFERSLDLRETIYAVFSSRARGRPVPRQALLQLNRHFRRGMSEASLQDAGRHFELTWKSSGPLQNVWGEITRAAVSLLTSDRLNRVRQCAGENCSWLFLDTSRNGLRRWCDMQACGNRAKVRRFRERADPA